MGLLELSEVDPCIPKPQVRKVIFFRRFNICLSTDVISLGGLDQEGVLQIVQIFFDGASGDFGLFYGFEGIL